ncbi:MAG: gliding motility-associated C-terminal domain-containing protein [Saprospiraceae bacterium]|nr:gliding motility-associated C-terminal domain-containing protein [Saprospiraceae bacterium]
MNIKSFKLSIFTGLIVMMFLPNSILGLHIIGGDVVYRCLGINTSTNPNQVRYEITFTMYRDSKSQGADFDNPANFGVYRGSGNKWQYVRTITNISVRNKKDIDINNDNPCIIVPANVGVQSGTYIFEISLPIIDDSYMISFQRCCRNNTVLNLVDPGGTGAAFTTEITPEAQRLCNNSPVFENFPPVVICVNRPINFNHSAKDVDGDSLVYEFCAPLTAGGTEGTNGGNAQSCNGVTPSPNRCPPPYSEVTFRTPGYTYDKPMGGDPVVYIDSKTGIIGGSPNILGQYVVGVCVKEYRNGVLISSLRRDFQFNVTTCEQAVHANIQASLKDGKDYTLNSCGNEIIHFKNLSTDIRYIKSYYWEFDIKGSPKTFTTRDASVTFPGLGTYTGTMILNRNIPGAQDCIDTANITVNIYPSIKTDFSFKYDTCISGPVSFKDLSNSGAGPVQKWNWNFGEGTSVQKDPAFEFELPGLKTVRLISEDVNSCKDTAVHTVNYFPVPSLIVVEPNTFTGCKPATITFNNLSKPIDDSYSLLWNLGDGQTSADFSPVHLYSESGVYSVRLKITSPLGCTTEKQWNNLIKVVDSPIAGFSYDPEEPNLLFNTVDFTDNSVGGIAWQWRFDTLGVSLFQNPSYTFRDTGTYLIEQIVLHSSGCTDTARTQIHILPYVNYLMPNAFTPNNDGLNDVFKPVGTFQGVSYYHLSVWNRWGERLFDTDDPSIGWNGQRNNTGEFAPPGVYAYILEYVNGLGEKKSDKGQCTLIR